MDTLKATELIVDFSVYPRGDVDAQNISYMVRSLEAGRRLPPLLVELTSKRIVDGVHRFNAHKRFSGEDCDIECILKSYPNEEAMIIESINLNATHGSALTTFDRARCIAMARERHIPLKLIAEALCMTIEKVKELETKRIGNLRAPTADGARVVSFGRDALIPIKRSIEHMAGRTLTKRQAEINEDLSGMKPLFHVNQLLMLIEGGLLDVGDAKLFDALAKLESAIKGLKHAV